jgi:rare lipoprotein A
MPCPFYCWPMLPRRKISLLIAAAMFLALSSAMAQRQGWDGSVKIGRPYEVDGIRYVPSDDHQYQDQGTASWYGDKFHGRPTSSGEPYDMDDLTAAHRTLPMPSFIKVTNLANGKSVVLRVNDRGPYHSNRIIDVSRKGAETLGFISRGIARVKLERVFPNETVEQRRILAALPTVGKNADGILPDKMPALPAAKIISRRLPPPSSEVLAIAQGNDAPKLAAFYVQVATLGDETRAEVLAQDIDRFGAAFVEALPGSAGQLFRVRMGPYISRDVAANMIGQLREAGYRHALILAPDNSNKSAGIGNNLVLSD